MLPYNPTWTPSENTAPGFPTIGNVLSNIGYDCTWIGKWHLSCLSGMQDGVPGQNGPSDYGFSDLYCLPNANNGNKYDEFFATAVSYPSPNGGLNGGTGGDFLDSLAQSSPARDSTSYGYNNATSPVQFNNGSGVQPVGPSGNYTQLNDAAIAWAFTNQWLPYANTSLNSTGTPLSNPWFCAVSFVNPHDITDFPWAFGLLAATGEFTFPPGNNNGLPNTGYQPPIKNTSANATFTGGNCYDGGTSCGADGDQVTIPEFPTTVYGSNLPPGAGNNGPWNYETLSAKPGLQQVFLNNLGYSSGIIENPGSYNNASNNWSAPGAWLTFLNYYAWLESCVDYQVGQVLGTNAGASGLAQSPFNNNTLVIFTSDHGEYAGSHGLHTKGGALYDESMKVPLIVSFPSARNANNSSNNGHPLVLPYTRSSVDLLPFLYAMALGSDTTWRGNNNDIIYYLGGRESISDAIFAYTNDSGYNGVLQQRRVSGIPLHTPPGGSNNWQLYQPFVLHTYDELPVANLGNATSPKYQPPHAVAFRTVDQTETYSTASPYFGQVAYGGGKLGVYSFWDTVDPTNAPLTGINNNTTAPNQYEYYNYSPPQNSGKSNPQEIGNEFGEVSSGPSSLASAHYHDFFNTGNNNGSNIQAELYQLNNNGSDSNSVQQVQAAVQTAFNNYIYYLECSGGMTGNNGQPNGITYGRICPPTYTS